MQNQCLFNGNSTLAVDGGKLMFTRVGVDINNIDAMKWIPMDVAGVFSVEFQAGNAGTSRAMTITPPSASNNTVYSVTVSVFKESDWGYFGPSLQTFTVVYTSDGSATIAEITAGLTTAINAVGPAYGVTASDSGTAVTVTSNTTVPQNINIVNVGAGSLTIAQSTAFVKPYGLAAELQARGLASATTGQVYTKVVIKGKQGLAGGHVNAGAEYLEQTVWILSTQTTLITALTSTWVAAPFTTPAYNL